MMHGGAFRIASVNPAAPVLAGGVRLFYSVFCLPSRVQIQSPFALSASTRVSSHSLAPIAYQSGAICCGQPSFFTFHFSFLRGTASYCEHARYSMTVRFFRPSFCLFSFPAPAHAVRC
ncbi:hypothetical protein TRVL_09115 [Trypanosoma vivax]|nr:hypothetical protein TRVL_09115 [Trypanosoma vivax]